MPQLPLPPAPFGGASPTTKTDGAGALWFSCFANKAQRVYRMVGTSWIEVPLEHTPTARGILDIDSDGRAWLTAWDDGAKALWRIPIPGFVPVAVRGPAGPTGPAGPQGVPGPVGPPGTGGTLTPQERSALDWLVGWLAPLLRR